MTISVRPKLSELSVRTFWRVVSDTSRQFDEWCEKPGERDSHKAVPIAVTPHRLIAAEVPLELSPSPQDILNILQYIQDEQGRCAFGTYRNISQKLCNGRSDLLLHVLPLTISVRPKLSSRVFWRVVSDTSRKFDEWCKKPGERDSHKAVPIAATPHRLIAAEVPLELSLAKPNATITISGYDISYP